MKYYIIRVYKQLIERTTTVVHLLLSILSLVFTSYTN